MIHREAQLLNRFKVKYFSDLINEEEALRQIYAVLKPSIPELIEPQAVDAPQEVQVPTKEAITDTTTQASNAKPL